MKNITVVIPCDFSDDDDYTIVEMLQNGVYIKWEMKGIDLMCHLTSFFYTGEAMKLALINLIW